MKFPIHADDPVRLKTDLLALLGFEEAPLEDPSLQALDRALEGLVSRFAGEEQFKGKTGQALTLHTHGRVGPTRLLLVGGGPRKDFQLADLRHFSARAIKAALQASARSAAVVLPSGAGGGADAMARSGQFLAEGALLGSYKFDKYLSEDKKKKNTVEELSLVAGSDAGLEAALERGAERAERVAAGVTLARDLVNEPAGEMTPRCLAEVAERLGQKHGLEVKVLGPKECERLGMGMFLAVARGSSEEPRFLHLTYRPKGKSKKTIALIGKGVTFDSGGLSLKPSAAMEDMKIDMGGAATVLAAIGVLAELGVPYEVHALAACTENMPSGTSYKLGDVLRSMSGKTVEINNTDAEGRLTLGDAITYALREVKPDEILDFATLTGACMVALGPNIAGVMSNDRALVERWLEKARLAGEEMWQLPLPERLREQLKSEIAEMKNTGDRYGGALTAGLFLKEFVGDTPWVHVDMAGPAAADKEWGYVPKGGTGFGVATIVEYLAEPS